MIFITLSPIFLILTYFHPEKFVFSSSRFDCLCNLWYILSLSSFEIGFVMFNVNYLVRLNVIINYTNPHKTSPMIIMLIIILFLEVILVDGLRVFNTKASCNPNDQFGCKLTNYDWS